MQTLSFSSWAFPPIDVKAAFMETGCLAPTQVIESNLLIKLLTKLVLGQINEGRGWYCSARGWDVRDQPLTSFIIPPEYNAHCRGVQSNLCKVEVSVCTPLQSSFDSFVANFDFGERRCQRRLPMGTSASRFPAENSFHRWSISDLGRSCLSLAA